MININLLDGRRKEILKRQRQTKKINIGSLAVAIVAMFLAGGVFAFNSYTQSRLAETESQLSQLESQLNSYADVFESLQVIIGKLEAVDEILSARALAEEKIELFFEIQNSEHMSVQQVGLGGAVNPFEFEISGRSASMANFVDANTFIKDLDVSHGFKQILLNSLSRNEVGEVYVNYILTLKDE